MHCGQEGRQPAALTRVGQQEDDVVVGYQLVELLIRLRGAGGDDGLRGRGGITKGDA